jgi:succinate dehydrogenase (ubiquinone) cytochrome b560 subunit
LLSPSFVKASNHPPFTNPASRPAATQHTSPSDAYSILAAQRRHRPVSPHLTIYRPQVTWTLSALNRITGSILSGGFYIFGVAYLVSPLFGWHLETASLAAAFATWPLAAKVLVKMGLAFPFTFHSFNGIRHLVWDVGAQLKNQQVIRTGWTIVGLSVVSALGLAFI